ncbi:hypothetical protein NEOLEDRAFT_1060737 [Neolentinus lepideus HHB14362 ss-1]|uniref:Uncharacterized protein n=1 Tax=Neolentinus lepideus HHB14362 ss-1 TaxID=1314782 RepID=A0A165TZN2_9AGAM|nr:hypothetical protein NEOLEDRAFT_1060737 [Neolentinus lepideus HHB14362 ss-1]
MVQGKTKGLTLKTSRASARHSAKAGANTKKGKRYVAPKQNSAVQQAAMHKKLSAKISNSIERQMVAAASSGKLTIMKNAAPEP